MVRPATHKPEGESQSSSTQLCDHLYVCTVFLWRISNTSRYNVVIAIKKTVFAINFNRALFYFVLGVMLPNFKLCGTSNSRATQYNLVIVTGVGTI